MHRIRGTYQAVSQSSPEVLYRGLEPLPTKAIHKGHLGKGLQQLNGHVPGVQVQVAQALQVRQLAAVHPLHGDDPLTRQLRSMQSMRFNSGALLALLA